MTWPHVQEYQKMNLVLRLELDKLEEMKPDGELHGYIWSESQGVKKKIQERAVDLRDAKEEVTPRSGHQLVVGGEKRMTSMMSGFRLSIPGLMLVHSSKGIEAEKVWMGKTSPAHWIEFVWNDWGHVPPCNVEGRWIHWSEAQESAGRRYRFGAQRGEPKS